jgi:quaternary ammonium compound-resistance protein SugE
MSWLILFLAGLLEVAWAIGLKGHNGRPLVMAGSVIAAVASVVLLAIAMRNIPLSTAYVAWTGIGIVGTVAAGVVAFGESISPVKLICTALVVVGIVGLKVLR